MKLKHLTMALLLAASPLVAHAGKGGGICPIEIARNGNTNPGGSGGTATSTGSTSTSTAQ